MAVVEMVMPKMGESIMEATILTWLKKPGDKIAEEESILEVATDKVDTEVPAIQGGILKEILAQEGDVVEVGKPIALITTDVEEVVANESKATQQSQTTTVLPKEEIPADILVSPKESNGSITSERFYSPLVKNIAQKEQILQEELEKIPGTGKNGRVTKKDMFAYLEARETLPSSSKRQPGISSPKVSVSIHAEDEIIEMDRMRKMIAERMVASKQISPHVTSFVEADVTNIVYWRNRVKQEFKQREGDNLTFTPIFIEAVVRAIKDYPMVNVSVDGDKIIKRGAINIGMAVALPSGNLIVPVIKNADQLNLTGLSKKVNDLAKRARNNKLSPDELSDGTYTVSNVGSFGNVMGTPIIMQPQVGILALGAIVKKPAVVETPQGDTIGIRHKMFLSHSYDHRVVDGSLGGMFVRRVADYLESFELNRKI